MRPNGLSAVTLIMCALNLSGFLLIDGSGVPPNIALPFFGFLILIGFVVLWHFWRGRNWARWLVLATSVLSLLNLVGLVRSSPFEGAVIVIEAMLGGFLLYWLNTGEVRSY